MIGTRIADDAKPQIRLLLIATAVTIALWFIPFGDYVTYPIRLFVTFIHEVGHAVAAVITGGTVQSLTVASNGSGAVYSSPSGWFGSLITSSAGYLSTGMLGVFLLFLLRRSVMPQRVLFGLGILIGLSTIAFGLVSPMINFLWITIELRDIVFTNIVGLVLSAGFITAALFLQTKWASFGVAFLAVQLILNALTDLATVFMLNAPLVGTGVHNDAANMAAATGLPAIVWVLIWIGISVAMISVGLRLYAIAPKKGN